MGTTACTGSPESPTVGTISVAALAGVWRVELAQLAGQGAVLSPSNATYTITLSGTTVSARADCNACTASFTLVGDSLNVSPGLSCTKALCTTQSFETQFTQILSGESTVVVYGETIWLVSARGQLRLSRVSTNTPALS
jgi:heat shock protein HslJ